MSEITGAPPPRRARNLLSSYYGASVASSGPEVDDLNIDGAGFNVDKYVSGLLAHKSLPELMQRGIAMVSEIKSLDSDMQMLVYENYNKFISATDTIRQMKQRVEEMEASNPNRNPNPKRNPNPNPSPPTLALALTRTPRPGEHGPAREYYGDHLGRE